MCQLVLVLLHSTQLQPPSPEVSSTATVNHTNAILNHFGAHLSRMLMYLFSGTRFLKCQFEVKVRFCMKHRLCNLLNITQLYTASESDSPASNSL